MPNLKINNFRLYYEIYGDGPPLLMILGIGANISWWGKHFINGLAKHFKVIVFDNRGTGQSEDPKQDYFIRSLADDAIGLLNTLNIDKAYIFGHSMGGYIAQELTLNYSRVNKLILCSTSCGGDKSILASPEVLDILGKPRKGRDPEEVAKENLKIFYSIEFLEKYPKLIDLAIQNMIKAPLDPDSYFRQTKAIELFNTCNMLKNLKISTLILHGMKDVLVPPQNANILANLIPNSQVKIFTKSAHAPFVEEPDLVLKAIFEFLL
ncbi:MAG: alpha/beta hydrolase [Candidatus Lokiarchaeota archaeon]|nr:alpha/beta hydrolase [Candidatus Lokiarchaeota archaeon]